MSQKLIRISAAEIEKKWTDYEESIKEHAELADRIKTYLAKDSSVSSTITLDSTH